MGLDMYLRKRTYIGNEYRDVEKQVKIIVPDDQDGVIFPTEPIIQGRVSEIIERVAYWRKANAIHSWFVENIQDGVDDCGEYNVPKEKLEELVNLCKKTIKYVTAQPVIKVEHKDWNDRPYEVAVYDVKDVVDLPTAEGFFFGGTDYDEYYVGTLQSTIDQLEPLLLEEGEDFYYQSSW